MTGCGVLSKDPAVLHNSLVENTGCRCHHEKTLPTNGFGTPQFQEKPRSIANLGCPEN
jgi:hypothetical protein